MKSLFLFLHLKDFLPFRVQIVPVSSREDDLLIVGFVIPVSPYVRYKDSGFA